MYRMKRYGVVIAGIIMLSVLLTGSWAAAAEKTGFVDIREVIVTSLAGKKETEDMKKSVDQRKALIKEKETELSKLKDELEKQKPLLKEEVLKDKEIVFQKKVRDYQNLVKDSDEEFQGKQQDILKKLLPEIVKVIQAIGDKEKYSMIIDVSAIPLAYYAKENDITKRVVEEFNKTYKPKK
jgi:outer membrane protein